jgi:hypothetical protein
MSDILGPWGLHRNCNRLASSWDHSLCCLSLGEGEINKIVVGVFRKNLGVQWSTHCYTCGR